MSDRDIDLDDLSADVLVDRDEGRHVARTIRDIHGSAVRAGGEFTVREHGLARPGFGKPQRGSDVDQSEAVVMTEMQAAAVPVDGTVHLPTGTAGIGLRRGICQDLLDVAIAEIGIRLQQQGDRTGNDRRGEGRAGHAGPAVSVVIDRDDARTGSHHMQAGAGIGEVANLAVRSDRTNRNRIGRILVIVVVRVIACGAVVAGSEDLDRAEPAATVARAGLKGIGRRREIGALEGVGKIAGEDPAVVHDIGFLASARNRLGKSISAGVMRPEPDPVADQRRLVGHAGDARTVAGGAQNAHHLGAVAVAAFRQRGIVVAREVPVAGRIVVGSDFRMLVMEAVVGYRNGDTLAVVFRPNLGAQIQIIDMPAADAIRRDIRLRFDICGFRHRIQVRAIRQFILERDPVLRHFKPPKLY